MGAPIRLRPAPSTVTRIGHVALLVPDFPQTFAFYRDVLGFRASDTYWVGAEGNTVAAFMHCGLGEQWTDHHTLALVAAQDGKARFDHSSFEVIDLDDVVQGGEFLKARGWTALVGRRPPHPGQPDLRLLARPLRPQASSTGPTATWSTTARRSATPPSAPTNSASGHRR